VVLQCERVHRDGEAEEVQQLPGVPDAVGPAEPHGVVEVPVDGLGVIAAGEETLEVRVARRDRSEVLGPVELSGDVLVIAMKSDGDGAAVVVGKLVGQGRRPRSIDQ
jgi:hypothetical protein